MGYYADSAVEYFCSEQSKPKKVKKVHWQKGVPEFYWRTKEKQLIPMEDMSITHLENVIEMLKKEQHREISRRKLKEARRIYQGKFLDDTN